MNSDLKKEINRLRNLQGNKDLSDSDIERKANIMLMVREFKSNPLFSDKKEQELAQQKFKTYLSNNEIEAGNEIDMLKSLIYNEVFELRIQMQLNHLNAENKAPHERLTKQLTEIQNQKLALQKKLGFDKEEKTENELTGLLMLKKRFEKYINDHREEFTIAAPDGTLLLLRRRVKDFDVMKHPWFAGRWLFNYEILKDVKAKKLSKEDAWRYLSCASQGKNYKPAFDKKYCTDYIDYCLANWAEITGHFKDN